MSQKPRILLTNDDGVTALGIILLKEYLEDVADFTVVAPEKEMSTTGHSLTLHKPLRLRKIDDHIYACNGGPADCVVLGTRHLLDEPPALILSGINNGANLGHDIFYSGTVAGARQGVIQGIPSVAISLNNPDHLIPGDDGLHFETAARVIRDLFDRLVAVKFPHQVFLNINVPNVPYDELQGIKVTRQGIRIYENTIDHRVDARGKDYFWVAGGYVGHAPLVDSDCDAVALNCVSICPHDLDTTCRKEVEGLQGLQS
jgi:5'-nucleotidase